MKKMLVLSFVFIGMLVALGVCNTYAECYNEDTCFKDYVTIKDENVVLAVNRETNDVELYWSEKDNNWLKPDKEYQALLQKRYNRKLQLREMQSRLNSMNSSTMFNRNEGQGSGRM